MSRIGQILIREQLATENSVARALGVQHFAGGRIGTLLLERGSVAEGELGRGLAIQHGCDYTPWQILGNVAPAVIASIPAKFAVRHAAIPFDRAEGYLRVALRDPADLRILDELFFVTGRKIIPSVAPEARIYQGLEKYYGERRTPRFAILAEKLSRPGARFSRPAPTGPAPPPPAFFGAPPARVVPLPPGFSDSEGRMTGPLPHEVWGDSGDGGAEPPILQSWRVPDLPTAVPWGSPVPAPEPEEDDEDSESISWEEMTPTPTMWISEDEAATRIVFEPEEPAAAAIEPPAGPVEDAAASREAPTLRPAFEDAPRRAEPPPQAPAPQPDRGVPPPPRGGMRGFDFPEVTAARDRDAIGRAVLGAMAGRFLRVALFASKPVGVIGWEAGGAGVRDGSITLVEIPWTEPSVFLNVRLSRTFYLGALPPLPRHAAIAQAMGGAMAQECLVQPVFMKDKPVAFLYAEFAPDRGATPHDLAFVRELAAATAASLAASIRLKKKQVI